MDRSERSWIVPFTGVLFVAFVVVIIVLIPDQDSSKKSAEEVVEYYKDHDTEASVTGLVIGLASIAMLFFGGYLRRLLRDAEGASGILSAVAFAGAIVFSAGAIVDGGVTFTLGELADNVPDPVDPVVFQTLNAFHNNYFLFFPVGLGTLLLASGISIVRHGALPKWLGWVAVVFAVLFVTPAFFVSFFGAPLWILIVSVMGIMRARGPASSATA